MATRLSSQRESLRERGRFSTQESEPEISPRSKTRKLFKSGAQGEFSGLYDKQGHHLKADGTPDMRFKENREEFEGKEAEEKPEKEVSFAPKRIYRGKSLGGRSLSQRRKGMGRERLKSRGKSRVEHKKSDGTPDMRFKENREDYSGQGYEGTTSRSYNTRMSKANMGLYEGNTPGEHSGKFDLKGHHLKNDGTPDMRFKENREEFSGEGFENPEARYKREDDTFPTNISYHRRRPPTPYALYIRENASQFKKENPDMDMNEVFRELAANWRHLSDRDKKEYYDLYEDEVKRYEEENKLPHRGPLYMRKLAEKRGLNFGFDYGYSKRGKNARGKKNFRETEETEEEEDYDEENYNPNEGIVA